MTVPQPLLSHQMPTPRPTRPRSGLDGAIRILMALAGLGILAGMSLLCAGIWWLSQHLIIGWM